MLIRLRSACSILLITAALAVATGCGGGGGDAAAPAMPVAPPPPALGPPDLVADVPEPPEQLAELHLDPAPVVGLTGCLHVGADAAADVDQLTVAAMHDGAPVSYGRVMDGVGVDEVVDYLRQHTGVGEFKSDPGLVRFSAPPTVHLARGTPRELADFVVQAVRLINTALPLDGRIRLASRRVTPLEPIESVPDGDIFIDFVPWRDWNNPRKPPEDEVVALAESVWHTVFDTNADRWEAREMRAARIWVDREAIHTAWVLDSRAGRWEETVLARRVDNRETLQKWYSDQAVLAILVHELLHALGMGAHLDPDRFPESIMHDDPAEYEGIAGHVLHPLDREALQAAYSVLEPGTLPHRLRDGLGDWDKTALHLRGDIGAAGRGAAFGVAFRNGLAQPWAYGPLPDTDLQHNAGPSGTVSWRGRLLGFTPDLQAVGGAATLAVDLQTLAGQLDFTGLEGWAANTPPGPTGSGASWGDGDLRYFLGVRGNTFTQTGGDAGAVTGAFFGQAHEAMGGVLERADLTAAFGGTR